VLKAFRASRTASANTFHFRGDLLFTNPHTRMTEGHTPSSWRPGQSPGFLGEQLPAERKTVDADIAGAAR
jgi:hypothetical protein